jgi:hypothetical protein
MKSIHKDPLCIKWIEENNKIIVSAEGSLLFFGDRDIMIVSSHKQVLLTLFESVKLESRSKSHMVFVKDNPNLKWSKLIINDDSKDIVVMELL